MNSDEYLDPSPESERRGVALQMKVWLVTISL
jgi:hypothetical protein